MCIRCRHAEAPDPLGYCATCAVHARIELTEGYRLLLRYLGAWAAFDEWSRRHGAGPAAG